MIRIHQSRAWSDDSVPIRIGIVAEGNLILVLQLHEARHRIWTGTIHAYLAIVIYRHERKGWIDLWIDDLDAEPVSRVNRFPIWSSGSAEWIDSQAEMSFANGFDVNNLCEI